MKFLFFLQLCLRLTSSSIQLYTQSAAVSSIIKTVEVSSITQCYNECWKSIFDCFAVGFLSSQLNNGNNHGTISCFMLKSAGENSGNGPVINLEVMFPPPPVYTREKLSKDGTASQGSTHRLGLPQLAIDGVYDQYNYVVPGVEVCAHTDGPGVGIDWWKFTFNFQVLIKSVEIYNRLDCCGSRINDALVEVYGDSSSSVGQTCGRVDSSTDAVRWVVCSSWLRGRTVRITSDPIHPLTICEIDFYGMKLQEN